MKKVLIGLLISTLITSVVACGSPQPKVEKSTDTKTTQTTTEQPKEEEKKAQVFKLGDTIKVDDKYEFTLTKAFLTNDRNQFAEEKFNKVVILEYSYKNLNNPEDLYISEMNFKVYDEEGNVLSMYPANTTKYSQAISKGKQSTGQSAFGFNKGIKLTIEFYDNMFSGKSDAIFEIEAK